jgi:nucleotide-binding universal stress UspA family protein
MYSGNKLMKFMPEGHPLKEIIRTAEDWQADLIIAGKYGRSGLLRLLSGNITSGIVRHSKFPLIIVPYNK